MAKPLSLIVACAENRVIGRAGRLPWDLPEDKAWFHQKTAGQTVIMGRVGFATWPRAGQDGRVPIVVTAEAGAFPPGVRCAPDVATARAIAETLPGEVFICGGQRIYEETLPLADRLYLTLVHAEIAGDTWFPEWRQLRWVERERRDSADQNYRYTFTVLDRVR